MSGTPEEVGPAAPAGVSRIWLLPMALVVLVAVVAVELAYAQWPMPPGVDPADWIQRSFAWVGLPPVTPDAVGSPFLYPPVMFPLLGLLVRATGSVLTTGYLFGGLLLVGLGATSIHLARRFFANGPTQLLFVGLAVLNGTTLQMLFWGGYPNFLALIFVNEALLFLVAFVRTRGLREGLAFYASLALIYLTHDLTFIIVAATVFFTALLLTLRDPKFLSILKTRASLIGIPALLATVGAYVLALRLAHIEAPSYFGSNPAAYDLDNLGRFFGPLAGGPIYTPAGPVVNLDPGLVEALLIAVGLLGLVGIYWLNRRSPRPRLEWTVAGALGVSAALVPAAGWAAHVDTDYTRFVYFLPLPMALLICLGSEELLAGFLRGGAPSARPASLPDRYRLREPNPRAWAAGGVVGVVLVLLLAGVSLPTISSNELADAGPSHDAAFLASLRYLDKDPTPGSVLTLQSSVRWVEAVSSRGAFDVGPTWLLFEPWQIVNAEETYWAFNAEYAVTNNHDVLAFSGGYRGVDSSPIISAPVYGAYVDGVAVPIVDLATANLLVNATLPNGTTSFAPAGSWQVPVLSVAGPNVSAVTLAFTGPYYNVTETATTFASGGATVQFEVTPSAGVTVHNLVVRLALPSSSVALLHAPTAAGAVRQGGAVNWSVAELVGPNLSPSTISTRIVPTPAAGIAVGPTTAAESAAFNFTVPGPGDFGAALGFSTAGTSNPAVDLPTLLNSSLFLAEHQIQFVLIPSKAPYGLTGAYFQLLYGFHTVYANPEWTVLER